MPFCAKCQRAFDGPRCPYCGSSPQPSEARVPLGFYAVLPLAGLLGSVFGLAKYRTPDRDGLVITLLVICFAFLLPHLIFAPRRRPPTHMKLVRGFSICGGIVMIAISLVIAANGAFDKAPPQKVMVTVTDKHSSHSSRGGDSYYLTIAASWRPGHDSETVEVWPDVYANASVGDTVTVEVHPGFFHYPWYGEVTARRAVAFEYHPRNGTTVR